MTTIKRTERILKDLDVLIRETRTAAEKLDKLDDKVEAYRVNKMLTTSRHNIRLKLFDIEDLGKNVPKTLVCTGGIAFTEEDRFND
jgi:hypothetical protein